MHSTPEVSFDLARIHYRCKSCGATGELEESVKHKSDCKPSIGAAYEHICTKSGKYPHVGPEESK